MSSAQNNINNKETVNSKEKTNTKEENSTKSNGQSPDKIADQLKNLKIELLSENNEQNPTFILEEVSSEIELIIKKNSDIDVKESQTENKDENQEDKKQEDKKQEDKNQEDKKQDDKNQEDKNQEDKKQDDKKQEVIRQDKSEVKDENQEDNMKKQDDKKQEVRPEVKDEKSQKNLKNVIFDKKKLEQARLTAFIQYLKVNKHKIRHYEQNCTKFVCDNIVLLIEVLKKEPEIGRPFLTLLQNEIDSAFGRIFHKFLSEYPEMPHVFMKIFTHWIAKYPYRVLSAIRIDGFKFIFKSLHIELTSSMFLKLFNLPEKDFTVFVELLKSHKFFSDLFDVLQQNVSEEETVSFAYDYDYENITIQSFINDNLETNDSGKSQVSNEKTVSNDKNQDNGDNLETYDSGKSQVSNEKDLKTKNQNNGDNLETYDSGKSQVSNDKTVFNDKNQENGDNLETYDSGKSQVSNEKDLRTKNPFLSDSYIKNCFMSPNKSDKDRRNVRLNILDIIYTFLEKFDDDYITYKIMKHSNVLLSLFLNDKTIHMTELNILSAILKILCLKNSNKIVMSHIHKRLNNFSFLFQSIEFSGKKKTVKLFQEEKKAQKSPEISKNITKSENKPVDELVIKRNPDENKISDSSSEYEIYHKRNSSQTENEKYFQNKSISEEESEPFDDSSVVQNEESNDKNSEISNDDQFDDISKEKIQLEDFPETTSSFTVIQQSGPQEKIENASITVKDEKPRSSSLVDLKNILKNQIFSNKIKIEFQRNKQRTLEFRDMVEKQLLLLNESRMSLHLVLRLDLLCYCSRFHKTREILKKQLIYSFFIHIYENTSNTYLLSGLTTLIGNFCLDYEFIYHLLTTTDILKTIINIAKEALVINYGRYPVKKTVYSFNTDLALIFLRLKNDIAKIYHKVQKKSNETQKRENNSQSYRRNEIPQYRSRNTQSIKKQVFFMKPLFKLLDTFFSSEEWLLVYDGIIQKEIALGVLTYDRRAVLEFMESDLPEALWRHLFENMVMDMPYCDIFGENGI